MGGLARLLVDASGIYVAFLSWALIQERCASAVRCRTDVTVSTTPYDDPAGGRPRYFRSVLTLNTVQSLIGALAALAYLFAKQKRGQTVAGMIGLEAASGPGHERQARTPWPLLRRLAQCAALNACASPFTFASLRYIDYPTMILAKSCKLVPVMLMNVVLYRRRFAAHKYLVVGMVTLGISIFMLGAPTSAKHAKAGRSNSAVGLVLLFISLAVDGATNSSQDEVFIRYKSLSGGQMMFWMNAFSTAITLVTLVAPTPPIPLLSPPGATARPEIAVAAEFIRSHPAVLRHVVEYGVAGALGQLFIFDVLEHFGALTLVTITVTRKLLTMVLSVIVYGHALAPAQWGGVALVFVAIGIEAACVGAIVDIADLCRIKRQDGIRKRVVTEETAKARLKAL